MGLGAWVPVGGIHWRRLGRHAKVLAGPRAKVYLLAAFTAERAKSVGGAVNAVAAASRARNNSRLLTSDLWGEGVCHLGFRPQSTGLLVQNDAVNRCSGAEGQFKGRVFQASVQA